MKLYLLILTFLICSISLSQSNIELNSRYKIEDTAKYTYEMIQEDLMYFTTHFSQFVHPISIGKSEFGLELSTIRIGKNKRKEKSVLFVGNIHAREDFSSKLLMKFTNIFLLCLENEDSTYPNANKILDSLDIYIMPVANPDGLKIAHQDFKGIADSFNLYKEDILVLETFEEWKANGKGIDLNASFDDGNHNLKRADNDIPCRCSEGYKGKCPAEPKETQVIQQFVDELKPLITVSFHTKGNVIFWADKETHKYFHEIDTKINKEIAQKTGFTLAPISKNPSIYSCGLENYMRSKHKLLGICVELSRPIYGKKQFPDNKFNEEVWQKAWNLPYLYLSYALKFGYLIGH